MAFVIELAPPLEERLRQAAAQHGMDEAEYARRLIEEGLSMTVTTGADLIAYWEAAGVLGAWAHRTDIQDSGDYARQLRQQAETRRQGDACS